MKFINFNHIFSTIFRNQCQVINYSTNEFDRDFYKLKNNSLYGKTVENLKRRMRLRLIQNEQKFITYTSSPFFQRSMRIDNDLIALFLDKESMTLNRPSYIGQTVLDLSKLRMYQLQNRDLEKYRVQFNCKIDKKYKVTKFTRLKTEM